MNHLDACRFRFFGWRAAQWMVWVLPATLAAQNIGPQEVAGAAVDEYGSPMAGVKVFLKSGDSAITAADGQYRLKLPVRPITIFRGAPNAPGIREGKVFLESELGLGWRMDGFNALGRRISPAQPSQGKTSATAARKTGQSPVLDTLVAEKTGFYGVTEYIYDEYPHATLPMMPLRMFPNSIHGMDPAEITAWKDFLAKPAVTLRLSRSGVEMPREDTGGVIIKADGEAVSGWSGDACKPGDLPGSVRLHYVKDTREFRDTIPLAPFWNLLRSFRSKVDSVASGRERRAMTWDWPEGVSARPERDWMAVKLGNISVDEFISYPDVNQVGVRMDFEGGVTRYGQFRPATESLTVVTWSRPGPRMKALFTWKSHAGHDLRISLDDYDLPDPSKDFAFVTPWPSGGLRAGESLRLAQRSDPAVREASLVFSIPEGDEWTIDPRWDGRELDWRFPFPTRGDFQLKIRATEISGLCPAVAESPLLRILPDPADSAVTAFEPNEDGENAAPVPKGVLLRAAWDFRPQAGARPDEDVYRFPAAAGEKIRIRVVNPNATEITVTPLCTMDGQEISIDPMAEAEYTFTVHQSGDCRFILNTDESTGGRYQFRVDTID